MLSLRPWLFFIASVCFACLPTYGQETAAEACRALGTGFNLGNMLEAPVEGEWGQRFQDGYATTIAQAGFQHVRLPVKWSAHASESAPYTLEPAFVARIQHVVKTCLDAKLRVVLNMHHYDEIYQDPEAHEARFVGIWKQIAAAFQTAPDEVYFELLNEPNSKLTTSLWNSMYPKALKEVRELHPNRYVVVGPGNWNHFEELKNFQLPPGDQKLIATFHFYLPFPFTHQGAEWLGANAPKLGRPFPAQEKEVDQIKQQFAQVAQWSQANKRPVYLGEFGAYHTADMESRANWTKLVRETAEAQQFAWAYWEFCAGFGAYDPEKMAWREPLLNALGRKPTR